MPDSGDVTVLLERWSAGDAQALDRLVPLVYDELRRVAARRIRAERPGHTLQATALVNEAYIRMVGSGMEVKGRAHFFAVAARVMRRILVDHARSRRTAKRGGGMTPLSLTEADPEAPEGTVTEVLAIHDALEALERQDPRKARLLELKVFGGLTHDEVAEAEGVSPATVARELRLARAWLAVRLSG